MGVFYKNELSWFGLGKDGWMKGDFTPPESPGGSGSIHIPGKSPMKSS
jgi:hypothetical protein